MRFYPKEIGENRSFHLVSLRYPHLKLSGLKINFKKETDLYFHTNYLKYTNIQLFTCTLYKYKMLNLFLHIALSSLWYLLRHLCTRYKISMICPSRRVPDPDQTTSL